MTKPLIDTHCHIHEPEFFSSSMRDEAYQAAIETGVNKMLLVGISLADSRLAIEFARKHPANLKVAVGIHPHEAAKIGPKDISKQLDELSKLAKSPEVVAIGECGFDFFYNDRAKLLSAQTDLLCGQLEIARNHNLPLSFHVRSAFDDFWLIFDEFASQGGKISGVLHSFTDTKDNLDAAVKRGLFIGVNGIATFAKDKQAVYQAIPLENMLLETDSPFLAPVPYRGSTNQPKNVRAVAEFMASLQRLELAEVISQTSKNAQTVFSL